LTHFEIWPRGAASGGYRLPAPYKIGGGEGRV